MKYIALIPAYEPDEKLIKLVKEIGDKMEIVVVNDGSGKIYNRIFNRIKEDVHYLYYDSNMGKGYALKTGLSYISDNFENYVVVTIDSDGQHTISDALKLCKYADGHRDTLVLGKRTWDKKTPLRSRFGNTITRHVFSLVSHTKIYDTQTGLRAFSEDLVNYMLGISGNRYEYEINVLVNLKKNNIKYHEISIETIYYDHNKKSHFRTVRDSLLVYTNLLFKSKKS